MSTPRLPPRTSPGARPSSPITRKSRRTGPPPWIWPIGLGIAAVLIVVIAVVLVRSFRTAYQQAQTAAARDQLRQAGVEGDVASDGWFLLDRGLYVIDLPTVPQHVQQLMPLAGTELLMESDVCRRESDRLSVSASFVQSRFSGDPQQTLTSAREEIAKHAKVVSERPLSIGDSPGFMLQIDRGELKSIIRAYARVEGDRHSLVLFEVTGPGITPETPDVARVLSSIDLPVDEQKAAAEADPPAGAASDPARTGLGKYAGPGSVPPTGLRLRAGETLSPGTIVQAKDTGAWYAATVVEDRGDTIVVNWNGWNTRQEPVKRANVAYAPPDVPQPAGAP